MASTGDRLVGKFTERALMKRAEEVVTDKSKSSEIFDAESEKMLPRFNRSGEFILARGCRPTFPAYDISCSGLLPASGI
jgi:hypothetical protein